MQIKKRQKGQYLFRNRWIDRHRIVRNMEAFQDLIVIVLCLGLFVYMVMELWEIFTQLRLPLDHQQVTAKILFLLILVELFRLLMVYLQEHSIAVGVAVEVSIVSVLREVIVHGALEISWVQAVSICGLLFILGALLLVCAKTPHMDYISTQIKHSALNHSDEEQENEGKLPHSTQYEEIAQR
ncbi:MAG: phosphate-starvation-inducible PsiE family protein [Brasilonema sp.]